MKWFLCAAILLTLVACSDSKNVSKANPTATPTPVPTAPLYPTSYPCYGFSCPPTPVPTSQPDCKAYLSLDQLKIKIENNEFAHFDGTFEVSFFVNWENYSWKSPYGEYSWQDPYYYEGELQKGGNPAYKMTFNKDSYTTDILPINSPGSNVHCGGLCGNDKRFNKPPFLQVYTYQQLKKWLTMILSTNKITWDSCGRSLADFSGYVIDPELPPLPSSYTYYLIKHETGDWFVISPDLPIELNPVIATIWTRRDDGNKRELMRFQTFLNRWTRNMPPGSPIQGYGSNLNKNAFRSAVPYPLLHSWN